jgi:hypothetical protein
MNELLCPCIKCKKTMTKEWLKLNCTSQCIERKIWENNREGIKYDRF